VSSLDQDAGPSVPIAEEVPVPAFAEAEPSGCNLPAVNPNGCDLDDTETNGCTVRIVDDDDEEEEDEIPLIRKNSRRYVASGESSGVPSPALSTLIGLQELSLMNFDQALEDMVPEDLLSEPADGGMMDVCADEPGAGLELSRAASRASSTLERSLKGQEAGPDCIVAMEVVEGPSALEVAASGGSALKDIAGAYLAPEGIAGNDPARMGGASDDPTPEGVAGDGPARMGSASDDPAPEGVRASSPSNTSMDVHVRSSRPHSDRMAAARVSGHEVALEVSAPDDRILPSADDTELVPTGALRVVPVDDPSPSRQLSSQDLGVPSFFSSLQVIWFLLV
jgi:hypothetical protein